MKQERRFNLADIAGYIAKSWIALIICAVIGAAAGGIYSYNDSKKQIQAQIQAAQDATNPVALSEEDKSKAIAYGKNLAYFENQSAYMTDSIYMQLNANNVYKIEMNYEIVAPNTVNVAQMYNAILTEDQLYQEIVNELGVETSINYIKELVKIEILDETADTNGTLIQNIRITIRSAEPEMGDCIKTKIAQRITEKSGELISQGYGHELRSAGENAGYCYDTVVSDAQRTALVNMSTITNLLNGLKPYLTELQIAYAQQVKDGILEEDSEGTVEVEETPVVVQTPEPSVNKQLVVLFAIIFVAVWCVGVVVWYIFTPYIRSDDEYETDYELFIFETLKKNRKSSLANEEKIAEIIAKLSGIAKVEDIQEISLVGKDSEQFENISKQMLETGKEKNISLIKCEKGFKSVNTVENIVKSKKVVLLAERGRIKEKELMNFKQSCAYMGIDIIGVVIFE